MHDLAVSGYTHNAVKNQLHAKEGSRKIKIRYDLLNRYDMKIGELSGTSAGNSITFNSLAEIKRIASFNFNEKELSGVDWLTDRVQPVFLLGMPDGGYAEWPLGVFILSSPTRKDDYGIWREIEAYDASLILREDRFTNRYRIVAGTKYTSAIATIINGAGINKVNISPNAGTIAVDKEFEMGTTKLEVINQLLAEINYTSLWVDAHGYFVSKPYELPLYRETEYEYKTNDMSVMYEGAVNELDLFNIPNTWVVTASNPEKTPLVSIYKNELESSKTSTVSRGRTIVDYREINDILDQATLDAYTKRIAYNSSQAYIKFQFETLCMPHHSFMDMLFIKYKNLGISSKMTEIGWNMELTAGGKMSHEVRRVITI